MCVYVVWVWVILVVFDIVIQFSRMFDVVGVCVLKFQIECVIIGSCVIVIGVLFDDGLVLLLWVDVQVKVVKLQVVGKFDVVVVVVFFVDICVVLLMIKLVYDCVIVWVQVDLLMVLSGWVGVLMLFDGVVWYVVVLEFNIIIDLIVD